MEAMDFMDPKRRLRHNIMLVVGYVLVGVALLLATTILLSVAYGFGLKDGKVIQSGLLFLSSTPSPAQIYINGGRYGSDTNAKLILPEATYRFVLKRDGYRDWSSSIAIAGGEVESVGYPFLFPANLTTNSLQTYAAPPEVATESPNQRWLLVSRPGMPLAFDEYDLNNPSQLPMVLTLPTGLLSGAATDTKLEVVAWADDSRHLLLRHTYAGSTEYVLYDRSVPEQSANLTKLFALPAANVEVRFSDGSNDHFIIYNSASHELLHAVLGTPGLQPYLTGVLAFASYSNSAVVYATPDVADVRKVDIDLYDGTNTYTIRHDAAGTAYQLAAASYSGNMYIAISAASENIAYVYENPVTQLTNKLLGVAIPTQIFSVKAPSFAGFSQNGRYALFENGKQLATYDAETDQGYSYTLPDALDAPEPHVGWMDDAHLYYVSGGQIVVVDYDGQNRQVLVSADPRYDLFFDQTYKHLYAFVPSAADKTHEVLTSTSLRTPADQ